MEILKRPKITYGTTERIRIGCGNLYITVNFVDDKMFEVFTTLGKSGGCAMAQSEAVCRMVSIALRAGVDPDKIIKQLKGISCPSRSIDEGIEYLSCADAIGKAMSNAIKNNHKNTLPKKGGEQDG